MTRISTARLGVTALLMCSISGLALAQDSGTADKTPFTLDPILVQGPQSTPVPGYSEFNPDDLPVAPALDGGALLTAVPGVTASRMGGHGLDIVIRGQQGNQLNIIDTGSITYGGCPNRMDPPTSIANFFRADRVIVERGYASVTNGPGGTGGTVRLERDAPEFEEKKRLTGKFVIGGTDNGPSFESAGSVSYDLGGGFYMEGSAEYKTANDYKDGSGARVRSGFDQKTTGFTLGYAKDGVELAFDIEHDRAEDVLFAGAGMDSPLSETWTYRLRGGVDVDMGALRRIEGNLFVSNVDHVMDNYSLRPHGTMGMLSPTTSDTHGGKIEGQFEFGATRARVGVDFQSNNRMAYGFMGMIPVISAQNIANASTLSWPDVTIAQTGLYVETETDLSPRNLLKLGLRYDHVKAEAGAANGVPGYTATVPDVYYQAVYGTTFDSPRTEDNFGGLIRLEHELSQGTKLFAGVSRSTRTADANERAMARGSMGMPSWVGNPDIAPEKHNQFDLGVALERPSWSLTANAYYDRVSDFILRDQFSKPGLTYYRNVSAELSGAELQASWSHGGWLVAGDATYTYGQNRSDNRPLAQIPPLQGKISVSYGQDAWRAGGRLNWATGQDRIDPSRDPGKTPGYATVDLFGSYDLAENVVLTGGINNLLDKTYANHLSRTNVFDSSVAQVNEPGRTAYLRLEVKF